MESTKTSVVWNFFQSERHWGNFCARCLKCSAVLQCKNKSTSALHRHLKSKHGSDEDVLDCIPNKKQCAGLQSEPVEPRPSSSLSSHPFSPFIVKEQPHEETTEEIIARLAAVDGISFYAIANSKFLTASFAKEGIVVPTDPKAIIKLVYDQYLISKEIVRMQLSNLLLNKERFSISLENYTARENRCYVSINLHSRKECWNLGMLRMQTDGRLHTKNIVELVKDKLREFNVDLKTNIVACVTDGETITSAFADLSGIEHQLCYVRGLHFAACDILYKSYNVSESRAMDSWDGSNDVDSSIEEKDHATNPVLGFNYEVTNVQLHDNVGDVIRKVRKIIRMLSQLNDDDLKRYMQNKLVLDDPGRWCTLVDMLASFCAAKRGVIQVLVDTKVRFYMSDEEFSQIHVIVSSLKPIKVAIERLSRGQSTLLMAEAALKFIDLELSEQNTAIASDMKASILRVFGERRNTNLVSLLKYLNNPEGYKEQPGLSLREIKALPTVAKQLFQRLYNQRVTEDPFLDIKYKPTLVMTDNSSDDAMTMLKEKINAVIELETIHSSHDIVSLSTSEYMAEEMHFYETTNFKTDNIKQLYDALLSIPSTTLDVAGGLVDDGMFISKYTSDITVDRIWFLKHFFRKKDKTNVI